MLKKLLNPENKIAILWFWKEGQSSLRFLLRQGREDITILDSNISQKLIYEDFKKDAPGLQWIFWDTYLDTLHTFDSIIKTPGISPFWEKLIAHKEKFISQAHIFFEQYTGKVIWITGTKGKSTTSTLLFTALQDLWYRVKLVWNIWNPVLDEVPLDTQDSYDYVVYELSSYMLQDFSPRLEIWVLNNIYPCHLDWHYHSYNIYKEAKLNILTNAHIKIINAELRNDREVQESLWDKHFFWDSWRIYVEKDWVYRDWVKVLGEHDTKLRWKHNYYNISAVLETLISITNDRGDLIPIFKKTLKNFEWLPHRLQSIGIYEGIEFVDDAIATTPESTIAAIDALNGVLQTLIVWGQNSWFVFDTLRRKILTSSIEIIIAFPDTSELIFPEIRYRPYDTPFEMMIEGKSLLFIKTRSMKIAVAFVYRNTLPWRIALLSSWAPSFSLWRNYIEKAEEFIREVKKF